ncbi:hypothetical protein MUN88_21510 [Gracilibacillus caseinilyticus]|uniref:Cell envelope-related function transcriptional attenuator common domain-containing protein n=1 Tax=Gracilibacillus caseinilyticus TaxID=2932256 RepID=A0ABY4EX04_9BACI|nr:hypothetical protein [Gracilibacillus caseinilyticus]UOQ48571.1 hypothetical protein MUN88_21510 [Gracilibacillus caseinilyticus]
MEEKLQELKTSLNNSIYKDKEFDKAMQDKTIHKIFSANSNKSRKLIPIFASTAAAIIAFILFISLDAFSVNENMNNIADTSSISNSTNANYLMITNSEDMPSLLLLNVNSDEKKIKYSFIPYSVNDKGKIYHPITSEKFNGLFGIEITQTFEINAKSIGEFVENNKPLTVNNPFQFMYKGQMYNEGEIRLDKNEEVIHYMTMRFQDSKGREGRNERILSVYLKLFQQEAFLKEILKINNSTDVETALLNTMNFEKVNVPFDIQPVNGVYGERLNENGYEILRDNFNINSK